MRISIAKIRRALKAPVLVDVQTVVYAGMFHNGWVMFTGMFTGEVKKTPLGAVVYLGMMMLGVAMVWYKGYFKIGYE